MGHRGEHEVPHRGITAILNGKMEKTLCLPILKKRLRCPAHYRRRGLGRFPNELSEVFVRTDALLAQFVTIISSAEIFQNFVSLIPLAILWSKSSLNNKIVAISTTK